MLGPATADGEAHRERESARDPIPRLTPDIERVRAIERALASERSSTPG
ncbi:MAG: hypothetical protein ACRDMJ_13870 [Solirubrobacteraceae bacterium]